MTKETIEVFKCEYCGQKSDNEQMMILHELVCIKNPINMPCSKCKNQLVGFGCTVGMNEDMVGGNVLCFKYKEGEPMSDVPAFDGDYEE